MNDKYPIEVRLIAGTVTLPELFPGREDDEHPLEDLTEYAGRLCTDSVDKMGVNPKFIQARIQEGHESIIEHGSLTFYIRASRVLTHELVRHRLASYSQRSQRYVTEKTPQVITPPRFTHPVGHYDEEKLRQDRWASRFEHAMMVAWEEYLALIAEGAPREEARYVLPGACETQIVMTMNLRELRHFIKERTSKRALPEMQQVAREVLRYCLQVAPRVFEDLKDRLEEKNPDLRNRPLGGLV